SAVVALRHSPCREKVYSRRSPPCRRGIPPPGTAMAPAWPRRRLHAARALNPARSRKVHSNDRHTAAPPRSLTPVISHCAHEKSELQPVKPEQHLLNPHRFSLNRYPQALDGSPNLLKPR